ncbi:GNAT family N-acetyltransferase [Catellatospora sp. NPDC049111]|uniref:bifunctional acetate--CoA ligase family protein/GNAT family N-acetyltransferase n=1 Tax=Catellatospora sp. NPDC049111 TaxID=3155271 RepID=UPI0033FF277C
MIMAASAIGCDCLAADGAIVHLRPAGEKDRAGLARLYRSASDASRRMRFGYLSNRQVDDEVTRLTRPAGADHAVHVACHRGQVIGVASWERTDRPGVAEFAVFVADDWQGRGIGTLLMEDLAEHARRAGIRELVGEVLPGNQRMLKVVTDLARPVAGSRDPDTVIVRMSTDPDTAAIAAVDERERAAERLSLRRLLAPASVAVVGAGRAPGGVGHEVLANIVRGGFTGRVYAVNPHADHIAGVPSFAGVGDIGEPVDLVVVAVPAATVEQVLADAAAAGAGGAVILSAGFAEAGPAGAALQRHLVRIARDHDMRIIGPNCLGVANTDPGVSLNATFAAGAAATPGGLAVAVQSGAVGIAVLEHAAHTGAGVSTFVSLGDKADVSSNDLLAYWYDDPDTQAVALYLESLGNPRKFARLARAVARRKPVLAVKAGRTPAGDRAVGSHTAAAAQPDTYVDALFAQAGVIRVDTLGELLDATRMLIDQPLPAGPRLAVVGNAGGLCALVADTAAAEGLNLPPLQVGNPVDLGACATPGQLNTMMSSVGESGQVDAVIAVVVATAANDVGALLAAAAAAADSVAKVPTAVVAVGAPDLPCAVGARRTPVYPLPEQAVRAMAHAVRYGSWRSRPLGTQPALAGIDTTAARDVVAAALDHGDGWQPPVTVEALLAAYGIATLPARTAGSETDALAAAAAIGYPVVVKSADPAVVHKTDLGAVCLDLRDEAAVAAAYQQVTAATGGGAVLVQPMHEGGVEVVVGVVLDPMFGPLLMAGLGGVYTDLLDDRAWQLTPVSDRDAAALWRRLRAAPLLTGYRGSAPADTAALEDLLMRVGRLAEDLPEVAEIDLNPVSVDSKGVLVVDAKLRLSHALQQQEADQRRLSQ